MYGNAIYKSGRESKKVTESRGESRRVMESHGESWRVTEHHGGPRRITDSHKTSHRVKENHGELSGDLESEAIELRVELLCTAGPRWRTHQSYICLIITDSQTRDHSIREPRIRVKSRAERLKCQDINPDRTWAHRVTNPRIVIIPGAVTKACNFPRISQRSIRLQA